MKPRHVPSDPVFFRLVIRSMIAWVATLGVAAWWLHAPLQRAADPAHAPNPVKAAWFLLWIQEVVSHGTNWMAAVGVLALVFVGLPWLRRAPAEQARWFAPGERLVGVLVLVLVLVVLALTLVALLMRGPGWQFVAPR